MVTLKKNSKMGGLTLPNINTSQSLSIKNNLVLTEEEIYKLNRV